MVGAVRPRKFSRPGTAKLSSTTLVNRNQSERSDCIAVGPNPQERHPYRWHRIFRLVTIGAHHESGECLY